MSLIRLITNVGRQKLKIKPIVFFFFDNYAITHHRHDQTSGMLPIRHLSFKYRTNWTDIEMSTRCGNLRENHKKKVVVIKFENFKCPVIDRSVPTAMYMLN